MINALKFSGIAVALVAGLLAFVWFANPFGVRDDFLVDRIVAMRVAPERLDLPETPEDHGMAYRDVDILTDDNIRLSAWEIPAPRPSDRTVIVNHPLTTTRYGSVEGLDGVSAEFLPMLRHLHDAGYNIITYDHRGQGESDGGLGALARGTEAPVGAGVTEWQDVVASLRYVLGHDAFGDDQLVFLSQCMGANATFLAWQNEPELFSHPQIRGLVANQPTLSDNMTDRFIRARTGLDLVDQVEAVQREQYGFGFANALETVPSVTVPILFSQVERDRYTFDPETGRNDIEQIMAAATVENEIVWIGPEHPHAFGTGQRFDAYRFFNTHPEPLLDFLARQFAEPE
ncbi:alpha/beta hydrolase [Hyphobacterium indicum]|uniref:alpha/beta hydrolase n=1 Tax=Hyphobacterium indicum TaxID=2162714 RepID=UPI000D6453CA|nr:alpha/beta fold hydrolase [Hyphobacterium indicum]